MASVEGGHIQGDDCLYHSGIGSNFFAMRDILMHILNVNPSN